MKKGTVDRSWFQEGSEAAVIQLRTERALDRVLEQRAAEAKRRIAEAKREREQIAKQPITLKKMYPVSHWSEMLGVSDEAIRTWCKCGRLRGQWLSGSWRITEEAMREFLQQENEIRVRKG